MMCEREVFIANGDAALKKQWDALEEQGWQLCFVTENGFTGAYTIMARRCLVGEVARREYERMLVPPAEKWENVPLNPPVLTNTGDAL